LLQSNNKKGFRCERSVVVFKKNNKKCKVCLVLKAVILTLKPGDIALTEFLDKIIMIIM